MVATFFVGLILTGVVIVLMDKVGGFSYRGYTIHIGAMYGTFMAFNVWYRIWPAQKKIITAIKNGEKPDAAWVGLAGLRSKHNTYMSVPLVWSMLNAHTSSFFSGGNWGIPGDMAWIPMLVVVALGWLITAHLYKISGKVKGF